MNCQYPQTGLAPTLTMAFAVDTKGPHDYYLFLKTSLLILRHLFHLQHLKHI